MVVKQGPNTASINRPHSLSFCFALLGTFTVWLGPHEIPLTAFPRRKALHLLKLIALQPQHQLHRDQVLDLLWPHLNPRSAMAQFYKAVHHVRQAFAVADPPCPADTLLELSNEVIRLTAPGGIHSDVPAFEQLAQAAMRTRDLRLLQQAVACYKGDLLPADRYDEWTLAPRAALRERLVDLLVELGNRYQEAGYLAEAADTFQQALIRDEVREDVHRCLMQLYALQGSRARALRQYQQCLDILVQELGVEPSLETTDLYNAILNDQVKPSQPTYALRMMELPPLAPLVGRQAEREQLGGYLEQLVHGQGGVVALEGEAGIGKTRLAQELLQMDPGRWEVLWGSAHEQEGQSPYMPVIEALRKAIRSDPTDAHLIPAELAVAIPELPAESPLVATADRVTAQSALFAGVLRFLTARAQRAPVVLILDDLHAADPGTLKLFHYLARQTRSLPLLLVGIWRLTDPGASPLLKQIIGNLERQALVWRLMLTALSHEEHRALLEQALEGGAIDLALANDLYRFSAGNPLFAKELVRLLADEQKIVQVSNMWRLSDGIAMAFEPPTLPVPPSLQVLVSSRLTYLAPAALRMLQFAAVVGRDIPVPLLEAWSRLGERYVLEPALLDVLDDAVAVGLLQERGLSYRFAHPLFRQILYQQMSAVRRRALHAQVAAGLERAFEDDSAALPIEAVAFHYLRSGDVEQAVDYLIQAGKRAEALYDHDSALHHYGEALSLLEARQSKRSERLRAEIYEQMGDVYRAMGNVAESLDAYRRALNALACSDAAHNRDRQRSLHRKITHAAVLTPDVPTAAAHLEQAWALLEEEESLERARMLITQALFDWHANQLETAIEHATEALAIAEQLDAPVEVSQACEMLAMSHLPLGQWEEALGYELRRQTPDWSPDIVVAVDAHLCLYQFRLQGNEPYRRVRQFIEWVAHQSTTTGNLRCLAVCHYVLGCLALLQGKPGIADENLDDALVLHQRIGSSAAAAYTIARQVDLLTATGDFQAAWQRVRMGLEMAEQAAIRDHCLSMMHTAAISNRLAASDLAAAGDLVEAVHAHEAEAAPCAICSVDRYAAVAAYYVASGELEEAVHSTEKALQLAQVVQNRLGQARAMLVQGQIYAARNEAAEAERYLAEAADIFRDLDDRYDLAQTLLAWASLPADSERALAEHQAKRQAAEELLEQFRTV